MISTKETLLKFEQERYKMQPYKLKWKRKVVKEKKTGDVKEFYFRPFQVYKVFYPSDTQRRDILL